MILPILLAIPLNLWYVDSPRLSLPASDAVLVAERVEEIWNQAFPRYPLSLSQVNFITDDWHTSELSTYCEEYYHYKEELKPYLRMRKFNLAILPAIIDNGIKYSAGLSGVGTIGQYRTFAGSFCGPCLDCCIITSLHELLHTAGARHDAALNQIMHPSAGKFGLAALTISPRTKSQVRRHFRRLGW